MTLQADGSAVHGSAHASETHGLYRAALIAVSIVLSHQRPEAYTATPRINTDDEDYGNSRVLRDCLDSENGHLFGIGYKRGSLTLKSGIAVLRGKSY